jgi:hypothetical protein
VTILEDRLEEVERNSAGRGLFAMSRAKLRRLIRATIVQGEQSFTIHNFVPDLPRADDDASFGRVPASGTNSAEAFKAEVAAAPGLAPARERGLHNDSAIGC